MGDNEYDSESAMLSEFNTKISDIEGKYEILRERILLSNESFLKTRDSLNKEVRMLKESIRDLRNEIEKIKEVVQHIANEVSGFARKEELRILERYLKLWEPLKFLKAEEVQKMIDNSLENLTSKNHDKKEEVKV